MIDKTLLRSQKNEVFRLLQPTGIDLGRFTWSEVDSQVVGDLIVSRLEDSDGFFFLFDCNSENKHRGIYSPGENVRIIRTFEDSWHGQLTHVRVWVTNLEREFAEPDLWASISQEKKLAEGAAEEGENLPFSVQEQHRIAQDINEIREFLARTLSLNQEQFKFLDSRLKYLTESSERLGRKDWINLTLSVLMTIIIGLAMPPEASRELLRFAGQVFSWLIKGQLLLPV